MKVTRIPAPKLIPGRVYEYTVGRRTEATPVKYMLAVRYNQRTSILGVDIETGKLLNHVWVDVDECVLIENHEFKIATSSTRASTISDMTDGDVFNLSTRYYLKTEYGVIELVTGALVNTTSDIPPTTCFDIHDAELIIRD